VRHVHGVLSRRYRRPVVLELSGSDEYGIVRSVSESHLPVRRHSVGPLQRHVSVGPVSFTPVFRLMRGWYRLARGTRPGPCSHVILGVRCQGSEQPRAARRCTRLASPPWTPPLS